MSRTVFLGGGGGSGANPLDKALGGVSAWKKLD